MAAVLQARLAKQLNDVTAERDALKQQLEAKNDSSESDALRHDLELERGERQRLKEDRDDLKERLRNTEMALEMMEAKEKDTLRQKSQLDLLTERFDEERAEYKEIERRLEEETNQWREKYEQLIIEMESTKETSSKKVKQLESQLYSSLEASRGVSELEGTLSEQNTRLQEYYAHMEEQSNTIRALEGRVASMQSLEGELKRANEDKRQLKVEIEGCRSHLKEYEDQCAFLLRDIALRTEEMKEAQGQHAECNRRLQQTEGYLASMKQRLEELTSEKSHMDQQLCVYLKDFEVERQAREMEVQSIDNLKKKLAEAKEETTSLRHQLNQQADQIQQLEEERSLIGTGTLSSGDGSVSSSSPRMSNWTSWDGSAVPIEPQDWRGGYTSINPAPPSQQRRVPRDDQPPFNRVQQSPHEDGERNRFTAFNKEQLLREREIPGDEVVLPRAQSEYTQTQCPICGKSGFLTAEDLGRHSATCTDFPS
ncbi:hypothetical protein EMCRGX_G018328 [Ephydatia muelleri]